MYRNAKAFDCTQCSHRHCDTDKKRPGSKGPANYEQFVIKGVISSRTCLLPMIDARTHKLIKLHEHYNKGHHPLAGGLLEQPNFYIEAMDILNAS